MAKKRVTIVGSGVAGIAVATTLLERGFRVEMIEKGREYPYPPRDLFERYRFEGEVDFEGLDLGTDQNRLITPEWLDQWTTSHERLQIVGGAATEWTGLAPRMLPEDFRRQSSFGFGGDWPMDYDELEPFMGRAESMMGVSGTDEDNPFAPPRSSPYPLPPFPLSFEDREAAARLAEAGISIHTTPQARTREAYDGRPGCQNFGLCLTCPLGARYHPHHHLERLRAHERFTLRPETTVRRILTDARGEVSGLLVQRPEDSEPSEEGVEILVVAAGGFANPRLLLLSADERHPDGIGNHGGLVGASLSFHHIWVHRLHFDTPRPIGFAGPWTARSMQFANPEDRGRRGGFLVEMPSPPFVPPGRWTVGETATEAVSRLQQILSEGFRSRAIGFHSETDLEPGRSLALARETDRFGDPFIEIRYPRPRSPFDEATHAASVDVIRRMATALGAREVTTSPIHRFTPGGHHMGSTPMGEAPADGVVSPFGQVHGLRRLFLVGQSVFVGSSGAVNPTLTLVALAFRTADFIADRVEDL